MDTAVAVKQYADDDDDENLVFRIRAGDAQAFESLMRRYNRRLYRVARSIVKDDAVAEEVLQEAYWKAYRGMQAFRADSLLSTWLTRIVINEALGCLRRAERRLDNWQTTEATMMDKISDRSRLYADNDDSPEALVWRAEIRRLIETKLDCLPAAYRTVFMLRAVEEMSSVDVAAVLDIPEATVRTRFFRARQLMREALAQEIDTHAKEAFSFDGVRCDRIVAKVLARMRSQ